MRKTIYIILILAILIGCKKVDKREYFVKPIEVVCDYPFNDTTKWAITCRVWGLLKYYHPNVTAGKLDWDKVFLDRSHKINEAQTPEDVNTVLMEMIQTAGSYKGKVDKSWDCSLNMNVNLCWLENSFINDTIKRELQKIASFTVRQPAHYVSYQDDTYRIVMAFTNEKDYDKINLIIHYDYRLLALFRYWNVFYYFFPYKHLLDQSWDIILEEFIPQFINADNLEKYHEALLKIATKLNDGHAWSTITPKWPVPEANITVLIDTLTAVRTPHEQSLLNRGDVILAINGMDIKNFRDSLAEITPSSHQLYTNARICSMIDHFILEGCELIILRNGQELTIIENKKLRIHQESSQPLTMISPDIGYVNLYLVKTTADVMKLFDSIEHIPYIIFDLRNYPSYANTWLFCFLTDNRHFFGGLTHNHDLLHCGSYYTKEEILPCINDERYNSDKKYRGKMVVLTYALTLSYPEVLAMFFRYHGATLIGTPTAGAVGSISYLTMPGEITAYVATKGGYYPPFGYVQRTGVIPDIEVYPTMESILEGKDEILEEAIKYLNNLK